ncbi:MAG TPA: amidohydrolase family protein [Nocardioidaceae bacterium]|nr:amidohydrolase family protein [Nocardioidaceae bacterium]
MVRTVFRDGEVFDGTGAPPAVADVVVEDGRIVDVGAGLDGDIAVDAHGRSILPGMIDCHVHLTMSTTDLYESAQKPFSLQFYEAARHMRMTLAAGVTTVRDAAGADQGMRVAQERGLTAGPRMQVSLNMLTQTGGHGDPWWPSTCILDLAPPHPGRPPVVVDGPEEVRRKVRELVRAGADVIKVATSGGVVSPGAGSDVAHFRDDEISMMVEEATAAGLFVMAHASAAGAKAAVRNGVRSIEHGQDLDDETIEMMVDRGTWLVPTLSAGLGLAESIEAGHLYPDSIMRKITNVREARASTMSRALEAGVKFAMGSDAPLYPHGKNLREVSLLVEHGLTPLQALHAATGSAAQLLGIDDSVGSIMPGKRADLVVVEGSAGDVEHLGDRVREVYQDGKVVQAPAAS